VAKKTKSQVYDAWIRKQSERHCQRQTNPHYQEIIQKLLSIRTKLSQAENQYKNIRTDIPKGISISISDPSIRELKTIEAQIKTLSKEKSSLEKKWIETYGPIDPVLENISDEELKIFCDLEPESDVDPFHDISVVEPVLWAWKDSHIMKRWNQFKINWDAYLDDKGLIRFRVKMNTERVIKERLESWLDILKKNRIITFAPQGDPRVAIVGSLVSKENPGVILCLNPFARKERILMGVIQRLKNCPGFSFRRKDLLNPERMRAKKLKMDGKIYKEIAFELWPNDFGKEEYKISSLDNFKEEQKKRCEQYAIDLLEKGTSWHKALQEAKEKFQVKDRLPINPLIIKAFRLVN